MTAPSESTAYLQARLALVEARVRMLVDIRRGLDPDPDDVFRGLYVSDDQVDRMLAPARPAEEFAADPATADPEGWAAERALELKGLARSFGLNAWDMEILLIALAPDLDSRFERLYGYLNDDVSRRRASIGLTLELCGLHLRSSAEASEVLGRFHPGSPLVSGGLLLVEEADRPLLTRPLRVPDRVISHLLGDERPDPSIAPYLENPQPVQSAGVDLVHRALASGARLVYIREAPGATGLSMGTSGLAQAGVAATGLDLSLVGPGEDLRVLIEAAVREARLAGGGLVAGPVDLRSERRAEAIRQLSAAPCPVVLTGSCSWDPMWSNRVPLIVDPPLPTYEDRESLWRASLNGNGPQGADLARATVQFRLTPEQVSRAATFALQRSAAAGTQITVEDVQAGARAQNAGALERLTRRIEPQAGWEDLVLPADTLTQLRELTDRARLSDQVLERWKGGSFTGRGVSALFAGNSGTGKTMSAEIVARALGLDLYVIDLSTVIDKYIGETEKNLERIFVEADRVNAVLLFDEADAIFGKRSEVQDAHDRYANVETAYLLQRIERFNGLAILTTNLRSNVDEAFTRRLDAIIDFPSPEQADRRRLWEVHLRRGTPVEGLDLDFLASAFKLSGGNISNIVLSAAFLAAQEESDLGMAHLIRATEREYRKLGHLCVPEEFGAYYPLIARATSS
ncbi:MAG: ATP-binding protein [Actinomycetota bacterium]